MEKREEALQSMAKEFYMWPDKSFDLTVESAFYMIICSEGM